MRGGHIESAKMDRKEDAADIALPVEPAKPADHDRMDRTIRQGGPEGPSKRKRTVRNENTGRILAIPGENR